MEYVRQNPKEICNVAIISPKIYVLIIFASQATSHMYIYLRMYYVCMYICILHDG